MLNLTSVAALLLCVALACAEPRLGPQQQQQQKQLRSDAAIASPNHPYLFLTVPRANGNGHEVQGFKVVEINDDDDEEESPINSINSEKSDDDGDGDDDAATNASSDGDDDDDDDEGEKAERNDDVEDNDDDEDDFEYNNDGDENDVASNLVYFRSRAPHSPRLRSQPKNPYFLRSTDGNRASQLNAQLVLKNAKPTNMMVSREHAGAIMVPDGLIEIEAQSVVDEKTGKTVLLVPNAALDAIPDGSIVALMDHSVDDAEEARANRVIVRRRRKDSRRNVVRRRRGNRRRRGGSKRKSVRVYQVGGATRRRGNRRGRRPVVLQG